MASTYSTNLKIELMATGSDSGTWGTNTNTNLGTAIEQAIIGYGNPDYTSDANLTITITNSSASQAARCLVLNVTSAFGSLTATRELIVPTIQKQYIVQNNTTGGQSITVKTSAGTGITVPTGRKAHLYVDGTNVIQMFDFVDINGGTIDGATVGAASASTGAFTTLNASGATTLDGTVALGNASGDLITVPGTVNSNLIFTDNLFDIGASGATRPRNLFLAGAATVGGNLSVGGTLTLTGGVTLNGNVTVGDSSADTLTINSTITSNLLFTDNTYDIGASGATRPRNLFLAGNATIGGAQTLTGALTVDSTTDSSSTTTGSIQTDGGVGIAKALYVGLDANIYGLTVGRGASAISTNTAVGASALAADTTGFVNTAIGYTALAANTTGSANTAVGSRALFANTTGGDNTAVGRNSLDANTTGSGLSGLGQEALLSNTTGSNNTAVGSSALRSNTTASNNTAVGYQAGYSNVTGLSNVFVGESAGRSSTANGNTFVGQDAGFAVTSGANNTILGGYNGNQGSLDIRTASNYIVLSDGDGNPRGIFDGSGNFLIKTTSQGYGLFTSSRLTIGNGQIGDGVCIGGLNEQQSAYTTQSDTNTGTRYALYIANASSALVGNISYTSTLVSYNVTSDYRLKNSIAPMTGALAKVAQLKPVTYKWNIDGSDCQGFIAHELAEVVPHAVTGEKDAVDAKGNPQYQGIDTSFLVATLTAAMQEQQAIIESMRTEIDVLKAKVGA